MRLFFLRSIWVRLYRITDLIRSAMKILVFIPLLFPLLLQAQAIEPELTDPDRIEIRREPIAYPGLREADLMWQRRIWRVIDLREKMNQYLYYPQEVSNGRRSLFNIIQTGLRMDLLKAYDPAYDDFQVPMQQGAALAIGTDTVFYTDYAPEPPYESYETLRVETLDPASVKKFRVKEDWVFDKARSVLEVRIIGICPVREVYDPLTGELRGEQDMYWIYFPELRRLLANVNIYNRSNMAGSVTYDDVFRQRLFASYIYKEDNVYDRRIADYQKNGLDALLEAEDIKENIRNWEADLWEP